jgi:hypothetical protein
LVGNECGNRTFGFEIGPQGEVQVTSLRESGMASDALDGNAQKLRAMLTKLWQNFVIVGHLVAAHGAPVRGVKGQNDWPAV